jgi:hypothetical protein
MAADYSTPEGALLALENAYIAQDIEAAVAAKNFPYEGEQMLRNLKSIPDPDADLIQEAAKVLELSFRRHLEIKGFPQFAELKCRVTASKQLASDLVELTEECVFPDGYVSIETIHAAMTGQRWGIVVLPPGKV